MHPLPLRAWAALFMAWAMVSAATSAPLIEPGLLPIAGGWTSVDTHDAHVLHAARFAVAEASRLNQTRLGLLTIKHARRQLVQGTSYSMNLMVKSEGKKHLVIAVVWLKPDGGMELTRWHWV